MPLDIFAIFWHNAAMIYYPNTPMRLCDIAVDLLKVANDSLEEMYEMDKKVAAVEAKGIVENATDSKTRDDVAEQYQELVSLAERILSEAKPASI